MKRILGLDLGVSSIGWALVNEAENSNEKSSIVKLGVRVNPLTSDEQTNFEKGKSITTNADRTLKRGMRRNLQRYKQRRAELIRKLKEGGIITDDSLLYENGNRTTFETYRLRAKAANEEITLEELARVLLMINKKRGYKSNRKAKDKDEGTLVDGMEVAKKLYEEGLTPGQYSLSLINQGQKYLPDYYRSDLQAELEQIWKTQKAFYPDILTDDFREKLQGKSKTATNNLFIKSYQIYSPTLKRDNARAQLLQWRVEGLTQQLSLENISAVMSDLNGQINKGTGDHLEKISDRSKELYFRKQTVGQYMMAVLESNPNASLRNMVFYRKDYLDEFEQIWTTQSQFHPELTRELKHDIGNITIFYQRPLRSQKGLVKICELEQKKMDTLVDGKPKTITIGSKVCPKSSPLFQNFRIWQRLNDLRLIDSNASLSRNLELDEKQLLARELSIHEKLSKTQALKILFNGKAPRGIDLNFKELDGDTTQATLFRAYRKIIEMSGHGEYDFSKMYTDEVLDIVENVFRSLGFNTEPLHFDATVKGKELERQPYYRLWHLLYSYEGDNSATGNTQLVSKIRDIFHFDNDDYAKEIAAISFSSDYGNISAKAISNLLPFMHEGYDYSQACEQAGYRHSARSLTKQEIEEKELKPSLELLPRNSLRNPVVEKILNQMVNVVNAVIATYGPLDEIRIELARDLKKNAKEREKSTNEINRAKRENETYRKILQEEFGILHPSRNDLIRYKLYLELKNNGFKTLYSNTYIQKEYLFSNDFDIEHIIPKASAFDDSFSNKTLELRTVNLKKGDKTAFDFVKAEYEEEKAEEYKKRIKDLFESNSISKKKYDNLMKTAADITGGFINRDLSDTQYISRKAREILEDIVRVVTPTTGTITERLRRDWGLTDVMQQLNWEKYDAVGETESWEDKNGNTVRRIKNWSKRNDHRHHAMDALAIAFTKHSIIQYLNNLNARRDITSDVYAIEKKETERDHNSNIRFKSPIENMREEAKRHLEEILVSTKSKTKVATQNVNRSKSKTAKDGTIRKVQFTPRAELHKDSIYGQRRRYKTTLEKVGSTFNEAKIATVANKELREALAKQLAKYGGDAKKAFTGRNSLEKNPIWLNTDHSRCVPAKVKCMSLEVFFTIRKAISQEIVIGNVVDPHIRKILEKRLEEYGGDAGKAFSNLEENPIWLNKEHGIAIKRVSIDAHLSNPEAIHEKRDQRGKIILDSKGNPVPSDFVQTRKNHHVAIFEDADGKMQGHIISYYEAMTRITQGLPVIDRNYNAELGWEFRFTMKRNEYFVFPDQTFNPAEVDLTNPENYAIISPHLFRVQKLSAKEYFFRHHLETTEGIQTSLQNITWIRIKSLEKIRHIIKVRINHIGQIVAVGEY
ncbi:MAG: type II CRISPR RNA-guided endonuclease Cas9 [Bacteroidaceae bacterium]|nr:type II CRISPR RNA-guided endonuclease Cas9 [Bacteroidaceae bacterium]